MKTLTLSALVLAGFAGIASASTAHDFGRYGVNAAELTATERLIIQNAISSDSSFNEVTALVKSIQDNG